MAEKDISEKLLESYNDVFADIINGLIFRGEQKVSPDSLSNDLVHAQYKSDTGKLHEEERDIAKIWQGYRIGIATLGIENQTQEEKYMPLRIIGYDGASYRNQFLQCMNGSDHRPMPVITIVLYFGTKNRWKKPTNLKSLLSIPEGLEEYVNDYKFHVFDIAWLADEEIARFRSDFRIVANFFSQKRRNQSYIPDDPSEIKHVDEVLKLLTVMTQDNRYVNAINSGKEIKTMCDVAERLENRGFIKGREQGFAEGESSMVFRFVSNRTISPAEGAAELNMTLDEFMKSYEAWCKAQVQQR